MNARIKPRRSVMTVAGLVVAFALAIQLDVPGRVSYALEKGKLRADLDHLKQIDLAEVAALEQVSHGFSVIAGAVKPSVVYVEALSHNRALNKELEKLFGKDNVAPEPSTGTGSGIIIDEDGHIVTNNHVIEDAVNVRVTLSDGRKYRAEVIGTDPKTDVAVIKISGDKLHPAHFGDSKRVKVGHIVLAIGSPFRLGHSVSHGIVSAIGRSNVAVDIDYQNWIQTDAPINPGNSGGPLINARGEVIGINTAIATESGGNQGVGFAIPSNVVQLISGQLKSGEKIVRGYLGVGIKAVDPQVAAAYGLEEAGGVLIEQVGPDSPAASAGLKVEDIILAIDGARLGTLEELQQIIAATQPEESVDMKVWRAGKTQSVIVKIGKQPDNFSTNGSLGDLLRPERKAEEPRDTRRRERDEPISSDDEKNTEPRATFELLGLEAGTVSPKLSQKYHLDKKIQTGAIATKVDPTGEAFAAGIRPGHTITQANGRRINNIRELEQVLTPQAIKQGVRLKVRWGDREFFTVARVQ